MHQSWALFSQSMWFPEFSSCQIKKNDGSFQRAAVVFIEGLTKKGRPFPWLWLVDFSQWILSHYCFLFCAVLSAWEDVVKQELTLHGTAPGFWEFSQKKTWKTEIDCRFHLFKVKKKNVLACLRVAWESGTDWRMQERTHNNSFYSKNIIMHWQGLKLPTVI